LKRKGGYRFGIPACKIRYVDFTKRYACFAEKDVSLSRVFSFSFLKYKKKFFSFCYDLL